MEFNDVRGVHIEFDAFEEYLRSLYPEEAKIYNLGLYDCGDSNLELAYYDPEDYEGEHAYWLENSKKIISDAAEKAFGCIPYDFFVRKGYIYFMY